MSSMAISTVSFSTVSEIAIVPDSECRMPTLMVSCAKAGTADRLARATAAVIALSVNRRCMVATFSWFGWNDGESLRTGSKSGNTPGGVQGGDRPLPETFLTPVSEPSGVAQAPYRSEMADCFVPGLVNGRYA